MSVLAFKRIKIRKTIVVSPSLVLGKSHTVFIGSSPVKRMLSFVLLLLYTIYAFVLQEVDLGRKVKKSAPNEIFSCG